MRGTFFLTMVGLAASVASASVGYSFPSTADTAVFIDQTAGSIPLVVKGASGGWGIVVENPGAGIMVDGGAGPGSGTGISVSGGQWGITSSSDGGTAIYAQGFTGIQAFGESTGLTATGGAIGAQMEGATAVIASGDSVGVRGSGNTYGVIGESNNGDGVRGVGYNHGVRGISNGSWFDHGVNGSGTMAGVGGLGGYYGVRGRSTGSSGYGVWGTSEGDYSSGVYGNANGINSYAGEFNGNVAVWGDCDPCSPSDGRFKKNVKALSGGLEKVMALKPKTYEMKTDEFKGLVNFSKGTKYGLMAEDLAVVMPEIVHTLRAPGKKDAQGYPIKDSPREEYKAVAYSRLIPVLISAIQELEAKVEALEKGR